MAPPTGPPTARLLLFADVAAQLHQTLPVFLPALWPFPAGWPSSNVEGLPDLGGLPRHLSHVISSGVINSE